MDKDKDKIIGIFEAKLKEMRDELDKTISSHNFHTINEISHSYHQRQMVLRTAYDWIHTYQLVFENESSEEFFKEDVMEANANRALGRFINNWSILASKADKDAGHQFCNVVKYKASLYVLKFMYKYLNEEKKKALDILKIKIF